MSDLLSLSQSIASLVERIAPSVVRVEARRRHGATGIIWSTDGHILTSSHAVEREEQIQLTLPDGRTAPAELVGRDPSTDLALLKTETSGLTPLAPAPLDGV